MNSVELVGIINITPDSFTDGNIYPDDGSVLVTADCLKLQGAGYIDVGAESTRPGAVPITADCEQARLCPTLEGLGNLFPGRMSLDTYHPDTVRWAQAIVQDIIINDVTTFNNPLMIEVAAEFGLRCIVSHLPMKSVQDIQSAHKIKEVSDVAQVYDELLSKRTHMIGQGIDAGNIILDPGIGFSKTRSLDWELLEFAKLVPGIDVMVGYSRKKFLGGNRLDIAPNLMAGRIAVKAGTKYLRVHDVAGHMPLVN